MPHSPIANNSHLLNYFFGYGRDRLQTMEKFRNGEIDMDSLCSELRTKAKCSETGVVVQKNDVDDIIGRVEH